MNRAPVAAVEVDMRHDSYKFRAVTRSTALALAILPATALAIQPVARAATEEGPMASLRHSHERVRKLLKKPTTAGSPEDKAVRNDVKKIVNDFLDYQELARRALGPHWDARTKKEQQEFVSVLRDLIERNYVKQLKTNVDYEIQYRSEEIKDGEAAVHTAVEIQRNGRTAETLIDYKMSRTPEGKWLVWDVITDDVSLVRNYKSQFNKIIQKESYEALVKKMKRKASEEETTID